MDYSGFWQVVGILYRKQYVNMVGSRRQRTIPGSPKRYEKNTANKEVMKICYRSHLFTFEPEKYVEVLWHPSVRCLLLNWQK